MNKKEGEFRKDMVNGQRLDGTMFVVSKIEVRPKKNGEPYISLRLGDKTGYITASFFVQDGDEVEKTMNSVRIGDIVAVQGSVGEYRGNLTMTINSGGISVIPAGEYDVSDFRGYTTKDVPKMTKELEEDISAINDPALRALCEQFMKNEEFLKAFQTCVGAESKHHNCVGGLISHTYEVIRICKTVAGLHPELDSNLLIAGALLHDIGKMESYEYDESALVLTERDKLVGHIPSGALRIKEAINELRKQGVEFTQELENKLLHLILSHHGDIDLGYGSPVNPAIPEAVVLFHADNLDSQTEAAIAKIR